LTHVLLFLLSTAAAEVPKGRLVLGVTAELGLAAQLAGVSILFWGAPQQTRLGFGLAVSGSVLSSGAPLILGAQGLHQGRRLWPAITLGTGAGALLLFMPRTELAFGLLVASHAAAWTDTFTMGSSEVVLSVAPGQVRLWF
jgi:hypothetical protein